MRDRHVFPAIFSVDPDGVSVEFPDLPGCYTCGSSEEEAFSRAKEALELHLYGLEEEGISVPMPSRPSILNLGPNQFIALIDVWMPLVRDEMANKAIKKTLTIPKWLNDLAEKEGVNFSHVLQSALRSYLGVSDDLKRP